MTRAGRGTLIFGLILFAVGAVVVAIAGGLIAEELTVPREVVMAPGVGMLSASGAPGTPACMPAKEATASASCSRMTTRRPSLTT